MATEYAGHELAIASGQPNLNFQNGQPNLAYENFVCQFEYSFQ